jgi:hypothetical protein
MTSATTLTGPNTIVTVRTIWMTPMVTKNAKISTEANTSAAAAMMNAERNRFCSNSAVAIAEFAARYKSVAEFWIRSAADVSRVAA